jgi:lipid II:glycine glycyltransferase (peptidoglycan interpeptide bridge formation enzyme)
LPKWSDLFEAVISASAPDAQLSSPWTRSGDLAFWFSRSAWSLAVVARCRQKVVGKKRVNVWVPDFFCNSSLTPLRESGVNLFFYPITEELTPDFSACQNLIIQQQPIDLFLLVHYFGKPTSTKLSDTFCKLHGAWLIEDATHVLQPIPGVGEVGDFVLYSPHKHLPIPDGAILIVRQNGPSRIAENVQVMKFLNSIIAIVFAMPGRSIKPALIWLLKRLAQILGLHAYLPITKLKFSNKQDVKAQAHPQMTPLATRLLKPLIAQLQIVAARRSERALGWVNILHSAGMSVAAHPISATPYLSYFSPSNQINTEYLFDYLQQGGLPVISWPDLPPEVLANSNSHPAAITLRNNRIYLPVHQTLTHDQILSCGNSLMNIATASWQMNSLSRDDWESYWSLCKNTNLLQSWQYGEAKERSEGWKAQRFMIVNENKQPIALAQVLTKTLPFLGRIARMNRGPLLLKDSSLNAEGPLKLLALRVILREAQSSRYWIFQIAPEMTLNESSLGLKAMGFKKLRSQPWSSGRISLLADEHSLLMDLEGKWRNQLRKGQKLGVTVTHVECNSHSLTSLVENYSAFQNNRKFIGLSKKLIYALASQTGAKWQFNLFFAHEQSVIDQTLTNSLGELVTIRSGDTVIYLIGSSNLKGRQMQANSVLLWQAILQAKEIGAHWFDIGGLDELTPKGVAEYKRGLNSQTYKLAGEWRKWF